MPSISVFFGITIMMNWNERQRHSPHFHVSYAEYEATIALTDLEPLAGKRPPTQKRMVQKWAAVHAAELWENWRRARKHETLLQIQPLG